MVCTEKVAGWILQRIGTTVTIGKRDAIDISDKRLKAALVGVSFTGQRQGQQGSTMKSIFKTDDGWAARVGPRDLDGILHCLGTAID